MERYDVIVIGAGLAGLSCGRVLEGAGVRYRIVEAADAPGGRVRTDHVDGFTLDRGFQLLLTAYPECRAVLDYEALELRPFATGALIRVDGRLRHLADPWRRPGKAWESLASPAATFADKLRVAVLRSRLRKRDLDTIFAAAETSTSEYLDSWRFSSLICERFFRPFLGGVFLEEELATSSRMFEFVFKMFSEGTVAVPSRGMQAIPDSLVADLNPEAITCGTRVERLDRNVCLLSDGTRIEAERIVIAADAVGLSRLVADRAPFRWNATTCLYFDAPEPPVAEPILVLDGERSGPINHLCVMSEVAPELAPPGRALVSASVVGKCRRDPDGLDHRVRDQLFPWFGPVVREWRLLRRYDIPCALPAQPPGVLDASGSGIAEHDGYVLCGDHVTNGSINGAMLSGRRAAETVLDR